MSKWNEIIILVAVVSSCSFLTRWVYTIFNKRLCLHKFHFVIGVLSLILWGIIFTGFINKKK